MKKFNKSISIEVQVDSIAQLLLDNLNPEFKHKEIVAEAIVGRMMNDNSLSFLYNSLNGYPCEIDYEIGDNVSSDDGINVYGYWTPESIEKTNSCGKRINNAKVVDINVYSNQKLCIEYEKPNSKGVMVKEQQWVNHKDWNKTPIVQMP